MVRFWNYGKYSNGNYGVHCIAFEDARGNIFYFSYETCVAFRGKRGLVVHENDWGSTTGKHLNWIDGGNKKNRVNDAEFKRRYEAEVK